MAYASEQRLGAVGASSTTIVQEGFVWVMSSSNLPGLVRLGSSLEQPDTINNSNADERWSLDYFARVDDRQQAHAAASEFLAPFRRERHLYETDAVVAATAIENCSVPIQFRKTSFKNTESSVSEQKHSEPVDNLAVEDESSETRSARQRAMAKLLFDAEQLLEDSELVTGPISYERTFTVPAESSAANPIPALETKPEPSAQPADGLTHRSPMNELLTSDASSKSSRPSSGSLPASQTPPPAPPMPPRQRPETAANDSEPTSEKPKPQRAAKFRLEDDGNTTPNRLYPRTEEVLWMDRQAFDSADPVPPPDNSGSAPSADEQQQSQRQHVDEASSSEPADAADVSETQAQRSAPQAKPHAKPQAKPQTKPDYFDSRDSDRSILMQMENLIIRREARQNLRNIRSRIGWSTAKGIPLGALAGFLLMLVLNIPDDVAFLIGFLLIGAVTGACLLGAYQTTRLWNAAAHWRRIAQNP